MHVHELAPENWSEYFDAASKELINAPVSIEIVPRFGAPMPEVDRLALQGMTYDRRDDSFMVAAAQRDGDLPSVLRHIVDHPARIEVDTHTLLPPMMIAVY